MTRLAQHLLVVTALFALCGGVAGCSAIVGDACETRTDCGRTMFCEPSLPDGYCTIADCVHRDCPDEGVCVRFDDDTSYCMLACESNGDCRDGYRCVDDFGPHPFCNDASAVTP